MIKKTSNSKYDYSKGEKEINRAFKMQEIELSICVFTTDYYSIFYR